MKTGIIGLGKMGGALLRGMLKAGAAVPEEVWVYDHHHENVQALQEEYLSLIHICHVAFITRTAEDGFPGAHFLLAGPGMFRLADAQFFHQGLRRPGTGDAVRI